jgi:hypothetical protein
MTARSDDEPSMPCVRPGGFLYGLSRTAGTAPVRGRGFVSYQGRRYHARAATTSGKSSAW